MSAVSVWRIGFCPTPLPDNKAILLSQGFGSTLFEGRWHSMTGRQVVYAGASRALCQLEKRVHTSGLPVRSQILMRLDLPAGANILNVEDIGLDPDWANDVALTRRLGDQWLMGGASLGLWVPSAIEPLERNMLLNPAHPQFSMIELDVERNPFEFDRRMF